MQIPMSSFQNGQCGPEFFEITWLKDFLSQNKVSTAITIKDK